MAIFKMFDDTTMCLYVIRSNTDSASRNVTLDARVFMPTGHAVSISMISDRDHIGRIIWERYEGHQLRRGSEKDFGHDRFTSTSQSTSGQRSARNRSPKRSTTVVASRKIGLPGTTAHRRTERRWRSTRGSASSKKRRAETGRPCAQPSSVPMTGTTSKHL